MRQLKNIAQQKTFGLILTIVKEDKLQIPSYTKVILFTLIAINQSMDGR